MQPKFLFALLIATSPAYAEVGSECISITDNNSRLSCYDALFQTSETKTVQTKSKWVTTVETSELTDDKTIIMSLSSEDKIPNKYGGGSGHGMFFIRCFENKTSAFFTFNDQFMTDNQSYGIIEYRLDKGDLSKINASASTNNKALGLWSGGQSIPFIKNMLETKSMIIRATPHRESPITLKFDITGIDEDVVELRKTCGW